MNSKSYLFNLNKKRDNLYFRMYIIIIFNSLSDRYTLMLKNDLLILQTLMLL
jgi:hypothetical protein